MLWAGVSLGRLWSFRRGSLAVLILAACGGLAFLVSVAPAIPSLPWPDGWSRDCPWWIAGAALVLAVVCAFGSDLLPEEARSNGVGRMAASVSKSAAVIAVASLAAGVWAAVPLGGSPAQPMTLPSTSGVPWWMPLLLAAVSILFSWWFLNKGSVRASRWSGAVWFLGLLATLWVLSGTPWWGWVGAGYLVVGSIGLRLTSPVRRDLWLPIITIVCLPVVLPCALLTLLALWLLWLPDRVLSPIGSSNLTGSAPGSTGVVTRPVALLR